MRPEHLVQFAFMGAAFSTGVLGVARPRVGLLSVGEEPEKGTEDVVAAHERLAGLSGAARSSSPATSKALISPAGEVDVVVTDGFTGTSR